jgi:hypothetical protein
MLLAEKKLAKSYLDLLGGLNVKPKRGGVPLEHIAWMCDEVAFQPTMKFDGSPDKANRWLGFVQGVLWSQGLRTIDQLREDVIEAKGL